MSFIGQNIRKIRHAHKLSQAKFAEMLQLARPSVGAYEEGRSEPKIDSLIEISRKFQISIDSLLNKPLTVNDIFKLDKFRQKMDAAHAKDISEGLKTVKLLRINQQSDYLISREHADFINNLENIEFPISDKSGIYRFFEIDSDEMHYYREGIHPGNWVLAKKTKECQENFIYILIMDQSLRLGRLYRKSQNKITLIFDNPHYAEFAINTDDVKEIWEVTGYFTTNLQAPIKIEDKIRDLENKINTIEKKFSKED
ncbi:MAG: LexA family transcriptional regulator [Cyclobacteriaceae bacterium]|nr:LexA family transcriptional regulator [Cyclobacteriaceae bacterium]